MVQTEYTHTDGDEKITEHITTDKQTVEIYGHLPFLHLCVTVQDGKIKNNGSDTETISISVVDGLEIVRGTDPTEATVLAYDGDANIKFDGQQATKTVTNGSVEFELTTDKPAGSEIKIVAESLADHPAERDSATIEVISA